MTILNRYRLLFQFILLLSSLAFCRADYIDYADYSPDSTMTFLPGFANQLFAEGDYYRAITEYKRGLFTCDEDSIARFYRLRIGQALFLAEQYNLVLSWYTEIDPNARRAEETLLYGQSFFRLERFSDVIQALESEALSSTSVDIQSQANFYVGISFIRLERPYEAITCLNRINSESVFASRATTYIHSLEQQPYYSRKDPLTAGLLGILPGAGYAYTEHYGTALASLVLNGLLTWATVDAFQNGDTAAGITYSIFATGFYIGNITGSVQSADRYNEYQSNIFQAQFAE